MDPLAGGLRSAGFDYVVRLSYNSLLGSAADVTRAVRAVVTAALETTGAAGVHLVGHSLGGLLVRAALKSDPGGVRRATVVTIASPHGIRLAR